ncbi:hypothetical protein [Actinocorallia longicatena]|uniref:Fenitrothion hydrolase n=1 Tax=Actinocorallia longicatena TaxID=111803 RepID=A0ABP6PYP2_9ACTN
MVLAHGIGGRQDLPIPMEFLLAGAALAVLISFMALGFVWQDSRFRADAGRRVPAWLEAFAGSRVTRAVLLLAGVLMTLATAWAAALGPGGNANPAPWTIYILFWVGIVPLSLLFGPVWKLLNPLRAVHKGIALLSGGRPLAALPSWIGYWPAAVGLFAFTWMELVPKNRIDGSVLLTWFAIYAAVTVVASTVFGEEWFDKADPFETYSGLLGRLAPIGRHPDGHLVFRNPFNGLAGTPEAPGLVAVVAVMLGSTAYDGFSRNPWWIDKVQSGPLPRGLTSTLGLLALILLVALTYWLATRTMGRSGPMALAHSLIPIAAGYVVAHYFTLLLSGGQQAVILWSDPMGTGADYFGTANLLPDNEILGNTTSALLRAGAVILGHVLGVFAAHDRAITLLPRRHALTGQLPLLLLMVFYTVGGLTLLFAA